MIQIVNASLDNEKCKGRKLLFFLSIIPTDLLFITAQKFLIVGAGPVGFYAALNLLQLVPDSMVKIVEKRAEINRPQVLGLPFSVANDLPDAIKLKLWPNDPVRETILGPRSRLDLGFWPYSNIRYSRYVQIGRFQRVIKQFLEDNYNENRFAYEVKDKFDAMQLQKLANNYDLVLVAAGNCELTQETRQILNVSKITTDDDFRAEVDRRGIYLAYEADLSETYLREGKLIDRMEMSGKGITYVHSNDPRNHVQIYTYPLGELRDLFSKMPESFKDVAKFANPNQALTFDGKVNGMNALTKNEQKWFDAFAIAVRRSLQHFEIPFPSEDKIKVFYASRKEYFYDVSAASYLNIPFLFIGDSSGCTDFRYGLSLGRGLLATKQLIHEIKARQNIAFKGIVDFYNEQMRHVIATEYNQKNPLLMRMPELIFKYYMDGQVVDGKLVDYETFIDEFNKIVNV